MENTTKSASCGQDMLQIGRKAEVRETVATTLTAKAMGSGGLDVYATPAMIALMEKAALSAVAPCLEDGSSTVGTLLNVKHNAASPVGATIRAEAVLTLIDKRRLVFDVRAYDDSELIGEGTHERFIINNEKFMTKTEAKRAPAK